MNNNNSIRKKMNSVLKNIMSIMCITIIFQGCSDDDDTTGTGSDYIEVTVPATYAFTSRFDENESSVSYTGQSVRNVLIKDLKSLASSTTTATDLATMTDLFTTNGGASTADIINNDAADGKTSTDLPTLQQTWHDFGQTVVADAAKLFNKIANTDTMIGFSQYPQAQMEEWFGDVITNSNDLHTEGGLELNQAIGKGLIGLVNYYQTTSGYLSTSKLTGADNASAVEGKFYTKMEHYWDEGFGYFGAARDLTTATKYTDASLAGKTFAYDSNDDGKIDYASEYNFDWAYYAAKWDNKCSEASCTKDNDFTGTIFDAFKLGRALISAGAPDAQILEQRDIAVQTWEKLVAASVIGYCNSVQSKMDDSDAPDDIRHAWSELRAFAMALQYNEQSQIDSDAIIEIVNALKTTPPASVSDYVPYGNILTQVKDVLQEELGFDNTNMSAW